MAAQASRWTTVLPSYSDDLDMEEMEDMSDMCKRWSYREVLEKLIWEKDVIQGHRHWLPSRRPLLANIGRDILTSRIPSFMHTNRMKILHMNEQSGWTSWLLFSIPRSYPDDRNSTICFLHSAPGVRLRASNSCFTLKRWDGSPEKRSRYWWQWSSTFFQGLGSASYTKEKHLWEKPYLHWTETEQCLTLSILERTSFSNGSRFNIHSSKSSFPHRQIGELSDVERRASSQEHTQPLAASLDVKSDQNSGREMKHIIAPNIVHNTYFSEWTWHNRLPRHRPVEPEDYSKETVKVSPDSLSDQRKPFEEG